MLNRYNYQLFNKFKYYNLIRNTTRLQTFSTSTTYNNSSINNNINNSKSGKSPNIKYQNSTNIFDLNSANNKIQDAINNINKKLDTKNDIKIDDNVRHYAGKNPEPLIIEDEIATEEFIKDPFLSPQIVTVRMYRDLITGVAKSHLPDSSPLKFPPGFFDRLRKFQDTYYKFECNELLLRAMTHRSYALNWLKPANKAGWWRSPHSIATSEKYREVLSVVSNSTLSILGQSILFFLTQSYLFQKYPTLSSSQLITESKSIVFVPLVASLASSHFLLNTNKLILADMREEEEDVQEEILKTAMFALIGAIYTDGGIVKVSEFVSNHVLPGLFKLRESVQVLQKSHLDQLSITCKEVNLLPYYSIIKVINEGTSEAEYEVSVAVGGIDMGNGRGGSILSAKNRAAKKASENRAFKEIIGRHVSTDKQELITEDSKVLIK